MSSYAAVHIDQIDEVSGRHGRQRALRSHFGITSFGVNAWTGRERGDRIISEHDESGPIEGQEELYLVLCGRARFELDGESVDAPAGMFVFAHPGVRRTAFAEEPNTTVIAIGGTPGQAYQPTGFEFWAPLVPLYEAGDYAQAADRGREMIEAHPEFPALVYNVACCESLAGRTADAVEHLRRVFQRSEGLRALAAEDSDLDPLRDEPEFKELMEQAPL